MQVASLRPPVILPKTVWKGQTPVSYCLLCRPLTSLEGGTDKSCRNSENQRPHASSKYLFLWSSSCLLRLAVLYDDAALPAVQFAWFLPERVRPVLLSDGCIVANSSVLITLFTAYLPRVLLAGTAIPQRTSVGVANKHRGCLQGIRRPGSTGPWQRTRARWAIPTT